MHEVSPGAVGSWEVTRLVVCCHGLGGGLGDCVLIDDSCMNPG